jgi:isopentenyl-diphosphate delta-isomerase
LSTAGRKDDHIRINLEEDVGFRQLTTGFERYYFIHQALPEIDLAAVDTSVNLFGKRLSAPILVSSMTGGTAQAGLFNRRLAEAVQARSLAMGVGSQRTALEDCHTEASFSVRTYAPDALIFANLGAVQLNYGYTVDQCRRAVDMVEADALILHLNPLQEVLQPEGDTRWGGLLSRIEEVCARIGVPVIVKEVGWGISPQAARKLIDAGASAIDVAGAGGTSWSEVEKHRAPTERQRRLAASFREWGISTVTSLAYVREARAAAERPELLLFASGGVRNGQDVAKAAALGADLAGLASPFLKRAVESTAAVVEEIDLLVDELRVAMFASGSRNIESLRQPGVLVKATDVTESTASVPLSSSPEVGPSERVGGRKQERFRSNPRDGMTGISRANPESDMAKKPSKEIIGGTRESDSHGIGASVPGSVSLGEFASLWLPKLEEEMKTVLATRHPMQANHYSMMHYHMGWADEALRPGSLAAGKRIRPLLCLIACEAVGGNPADAMPAAAAVEILHNFSLVHDDIEDGDEIRRHRPTVWALWGVPQAINVGDGLFALAYAALMRSALNPPADAQLSSGGGNGLALVALDRFTEICIGLT